MWYVCMYHAITIIMCMYVIIMYVCVLIINGNMYGNNNNVYK
jgi:hypothetical protein